MMEPVFKKCKMCGIPLNREITSQDDHDSCFKCAEEKRKFTPKKEEISSEEAKK